MATQLTDTGDEIVAALERRTPGTLNQIQRATYDISKRYESIDENCTNDVAVVHNLS